MSQFLLKISMISYAMFLSLNLLRHYKGTNLNLVVITDCDQLLPCGWENQFVDRQGMTLNVANLRPSIGCPKLHISIKSSTGNMAASGGICNISHRWNMASQNLQLQRYVSLIKVNSRFNLKIYGMLNQVHDNSLHLWFNTHSIWTTGLLFPPTSH